METNLRKNNEPLVGLVARAADGVSPLSGMPSRPLGRAPRSLVIGPRGGPLLFRGGEASARSLLPTYHARQPSRHDI
jgi:hypothetical protein